MVRHGEHAVEFPQEAVSRVTHPDKDNEDLVHGDSSSEVAVKGRRVVRRRTDASYVRGLTRRTSSFDSSTYDASAL